MSLKTLSMENFGNEILFIEDASKTGDKSTSQNQSDSNIARPDDQKQNLNEKDTESFDLKSPSKSDEEFESELAEFTTAIEDILSPELKNVNGKSSAKVKKTIPNVTKQWIQDLKKRLQLIQD